MKEINTEGEGKVIQDHEGSFEGDCQIKRAQQVEEVLHVGKKQCYLSLNPNTSRLKLRKRRCI